VFQALPPGGIILAVVTLLNLRGLADAARAFLLPTMLFMESAELPGGAVEEEDGPVPACRREVSEELGLDRPVGRAWPGSTMRGVRSAARHTHSGGGSRLPHRE